MAVKKVGEVVKEARKAAGLTQDRLAARVSGVSAADIGRLERGEANLTNEQLKRVAKALGITQASLLKAPKNGASASASGGSSASSASGMRLTATEKKLVKAYRAASAEVKKSAMSLLTGEDAGEGVASALGGGVASALGGGLGGSLGEVLGDVLGGLIK